MFIIGKIVGLAERNLASLPSINMADITYSCLCDSPVFVRDTDSLGGILTFVNPFDLISYNLPATNLYAGDSLTKEQAERVASNNTDERFEERDILSRVEDMTIYTRITKGHQVRKDILGVPNSWEPLTKNNSSGAVNATEEHRRIEHLKAWSLNSSVSARDYYQGYVECLVKGWLYPDTRPIIKSVNLNVNVNGDTYKMHFARSATKNIIDSRISTAIRHSRLSRNGGITLGMTLLKSIKLGSNQVTLDINRDNVRLLQTIARQIGYFIPVKYRRVQGLDRDGLISTERVLEIAI